MDELEQRLICAHCIREDYLSDLIRQECVEGKCSYCGDTNNTVELIWVANRIESAFDQHFEVTSTEPDVLQSMMLRDKESSYEWYREGELAAISIMNALDATEEIGEDVRRILDDRHGDWDSAMAGYETPFSEESHYEEIVPRSQEWENGWRDFVRSITSEVRYFSREAADRLEALFEGIEGQLTTSGSPVIISAGPSTDILELHRARPFQSSERLEAALARPDFELSAPPARIAASGRMNAKGISTFYGATTRETALAEVRPPAGRLP